MTSNFQKDDYFRKAHQGGSSCKRRLISDNGKGRLLLSKETQRNLKNFNLKLFNQSILKNVLQFPALEGSDDGAELTTNSPAHIVTSYLLNDFSSTMVTLNFPKISPFQPIPNFHFIYGCEQN